MLLHHKPVPPTCQGPELSGSSSLSDLPTAVDGDVSRGQVSVRRRHLASSLFRAVLGCRFSKVKFLLNNGMRPNVRNDRGQNLLVVALSIQDDERRDSMFRYLLRRGVDPRHVDSTTGRDVLSSAALLGRSRQVQEILEAALGELDLTSRDHEGMTALHHATREGHLDVVRLLIYSMDKYRLSVDIADHHGLTPYIYARRLGYFSIGECLKHEGHCSPRQFDSSKYISVEDWDDIGCQERMTEAKIRRQRERARCKINGRPPHKIPKMEFAGYKPKLPQITISDPASSASMSDVDVTITDKSQSTVNFDDSQIFDKHQARKNGTSNPPGVLKPSGRGAAPLFLGTQRQSMDTAFALMGFKARNSLEVRHPDHFVGSEFDRSKITEYPSVLSSVGAMMDIVSAQNTDAFCAVAKPRTPPPPKVTVKVKERKKVSTLAILFGRDHANRRRRSMRRATNAMAYSTNRPKPILEPVKEKKRKAKK